MSDEPIAALITIEDGADAKAKPLRQNFKYLDDRITAQATNISNKESTSMKGAANGYCGLDSNGKIPFTQKDDIISSATSEILSSIYPVGSIYITTSTSDTCPIASLISDSTWEKVSSGRVLQGADSSHQPNTTIAAGLPNITGCGGSTVKTPLASGAMYYTSDAGALSSGGWAMANMYFDASRSSSVYGNNTTVQPPAYVVNIWRRTA